MNQYVEKPVEKSMSLKYSNLDFGDALILMKRGEFVAHQGLPYLAVGFNVDVKRFVQHEIKNDKLLFETLHYKTFNTSELMREDWYLIVLKM